MVIDKFYFQKIVIYNKMIKHNNILIVNTHTPNIEHCNDKMYKL